MIQRSKMDVIFSPAFSTPCLSSGPANREVMRDIFQSRYLRSKLRTNNSRERP